MTATRSVHARHGDAARSRRRPRLAADKAIIVLDASGSMWGADRRQAEARDRPRVAAQRAAVDARRSRTRLHGLWPSREGQLRRHRADRPAGSGTASAISTAADNLKFLGKTPLSHAVKQAAEALKYTEDKATVILITDGLETCNADPCALGKELEAAGVDFTAHVVGFGLTAEEGRQVACLADNTGGKYIQADDAKALEEALVETVVAPGACARTGACSGARAGEARIQLHPERRARRGRRSDQGRQRLGDLQGQVRRHARRQHHHRIQRLQGQSRAGRLRRRRRMGEAEAEQLVKIEAGQVYKPVFVLNAGTLIIHPRPSEGADIDTGAAVVDRLSRRRRTVDHLRRHQDRPSGRRPEGDRRDRRGRGHRDHPARRRPDGREGHHRRRRPYRGQCLLHRRRRQGRRAGLAFQVVKAKKKIDGSREDLGTRYGPDSKYDLPPGDYVLIADDGSGDRRGAVQPEGRRDHGAFRAARCRRAGDHRAGASFIEVFAAKKDIQGNRKPFGNAYADMHQTTLPAGDYAIVVTMAGDNACQEGGHGDRQGRRTARK